MAKQTNITSAAWEGCSKIVKAITDSDAAHAQAAATNPTTAPNWDAMANSFASLSAALAWGSIILAAVAIIAGLAWGRFIAIRAENEARTEAKRTAEALIAEWLGKEAPGLIRAHVELLRNTTLGDGDDDAAADAMGEAAG